MNFSKPTRLFIFLLAFSTFSFISCNDDDDDGDSRSSIERKFEGDWEGESLTVDNTDLMADNSIKDLYLEFDDDKECSMSFEIWNGNEYVEVELEGDWELSEDEDDEIELELDLCDNGDTWEFKFKDDDETLILSNDSCDGTEQELEFSKD